MDVEATCVIVGASHGGVSCAFALRRAGWSGRVILVDAEDRTPYHRPPLSKTYLTGSGEPKLLQPEDAYARAEIELWLGTRVAALNPGERKVRFMDGTELNYDRLVLATGGWPVIPPIPGLGHHPAVHVLRSAADADDIRAALAGKTNLSVAIIGGGFIGLEVAASLRQTDTQVTLFEREERLLARVAAPPLSDYFAELHTRNGVDLRLGQTIVDVVKQPDSTALLIDSDGHPVVADLVVLGVGITPATELAVAAGLTVNKGIIVNAQGRTSDPNIYACGDCTEFDHPRYGAGLRLESVQHATDQAGTIATSMCGGNAQYAEIPWFWSDQYDVKLQQVGLSAGYDEVVVRREEDSFSLWYFRGDELLSVDAVNHGKAYVLGGRYLRSRALLDKEKLGDATVPFRPDNFLR